jgi:hypothetical protein
MVPPRPGARRGTNDPLWPLHLRRSNSFGLAFSNNVHPHLRVLRHQRPRHPARHHLCAARAWAWRRECLGRSPEDTRTACYRSVAAWPGWHLEPARHRVPVQLQLLRQRQLPELRADVRAAPPRTSPGPARQLSVSLGGERSRRRVAPDHRTRWQQQDGNRSMAIRAMCAARSPRSDDGVHVARVWSGCTRCSDPVSRAVNSAGRGAPSDRCGRAPQLRRPSSVAPRLASRA